MACLRQTLGGRSGRPLTHSSYTTTRDVTCFRQQRPDTGWLPYAAFVAVSASDRRAHRAAAREIISQLTDPLLTRPREANLAAGLTIFLLGLAKKLVLADTFAHFSDVGFDAAAHGAALSFFEAWYAALAYALQIYFDLSGYSGIM